MQPIRFLFFLLAMAAEPCFSQYLPIKPTRTISFTTDEGSYMDVDVSPDGKTLAFDLLGDLYTVRTTGGEAHQLTRGIALNFGPVWSPDGKKIAYISDTSGSYQLNLIDTGRTFHRVLEAPERPMGPETNPVWTRDGHYVIVDKTSYGIGGGKTTLELDGSFIGSPSDNTIYFHKYTKVFRYDKREKVTSQPFSFPNITPRAVVSPDGHWCTYFVDSNAQTGLMIRDLTNNESRLLIPALTQKDLRFGQRYMRTHYAFSPDSRCIYIGFGGKIHRVFIENGKDEIVPFIARVKADLGPFDYHTSQVTYDSVMVKGIRSVQVSPDGKRVTFMALDRIYVMDLPNGKPHLLTRQPVGQFQPAWSSDSKWICYVSWNDTVGGYLWRVSASGGDPERLTDTPGLYQRPVWSPDGKLIAVAKGKPQLGDRDDVGLGEVETVSINDRSVKIIHDSVPLINNLSFSTDGQRIIFTSFMPRGRIGAIPYLISKDLQGNNPDTLIVGSKGAIVFAQKALSPDGRYFVYSSAEELFLTPISSLQDPVVIPGPGQTSAVIRFASGVDPYWEKGGKVLAWNFAGRLYKVDPDKIIAAAEKKSSAEIIEPRAYNFITAWVKPDEIIDLPVKMPTMHASGIIAIKNVRIITMRGDEVIERGAILIKDGRIVSVGSMSSLMIPAGIKVLDGSGATLMPGLIDLHLHMRIPSDVYPQQSWMFMINLAYGVTTARDPSHSLDAYGYAEMVRSGQMLGPRLYTVGRAVRFEDGIMQFSTLEDARTVTERRKEMGSIFVKNYLTSTRIRHQWLILACRELGLNMTNEGWRDPRLDLGMVKDGNTGFEHNPDWGDVYKDVKLLIAKSGTWLTPTIQVAVNSEPGKEYFKQVYWREPNEKLRHFTYSNPKGKPDLNGAESIEVIMNAHSHDTVTPDLLYPAKVDAEIRKLGGRVTLGSHGNDEGIGAHNELWALQMGGLTNMEALRAGTIMGAEGLGLQRDLGSLEVGKIADLLILNKNPLDDIHNSREIRYVMKDGILYDGNTLDEIWPVVKKCPEWRMPEDRH